MIEFPAAILLQAEPQGSPLGGFLVPMMLIFLIFYFLLIRPQQKRQKQQDAMIKGVEKGDSVVTAGGLHGKVTGVTDDVLTLDVGSVKSDRIRVKVSRARVEQVQKSSKGEDS